MLKRGSDMALKQNIPAALCYHSSAKDRQLPARGAVKKLM
jgi:hypothetical protein